MKATVLPRTARNTPRNGGQLPKLSTKLMSRMGMTLEIPVEIWQKMTYYTEVSSPNEVTGIGTVIMKSPRDLLVTEIMVPHQNTSPGICEFKEGELNAIIADLFERDPSRVKHLRFRWHSHGTGAVFWSGIDEADIEAWESDWVVNLVMNVRGEHLARVDCFAPLRVCDERVNVKIVYPEDAKMRDECRAELAEKLTIISQPAANTKNGSWLF